MIKWTACLGKIINLSLFPLHKNWRILIVSRPPSPASGSFLSHICIFSFISREHPWIFVSLSSSTFLFPWGTYLRIHFYLYATRGPLLVKVMNIPSVISSWNYGKHRRSATFLEGNILTPSPLALNIRFWVGVSYSHPEGTLILLCLSSHLVNYLFHYPEQCLGISRNEYF